jgi:fructokinase
MTEQPNTSKELTIVGLGEALFDYFTPDRIVLGGAPVNLAVHANQLLQGRGRGVVASSIGTDELGDQLQQELSQRGMTTEYLSVTSEYPTGTVEVDVDEAGSPEYRILENVAWDHLFFTSSWGELAPTCSAVCFGTLAQRSPESRAAIQRFLTNSPQALTVCDLNLRQYFYTADIIHDSLQAADVLKLNEQELIAVGKALDEETIERSLDQRVAALMNRFAIKVLILTRGKLGTVLFTDERKFEGDVREYPRHADADDVGAGDACCAAIIVGLLLDKPLPEIVNLANQVGAYVASQAGATPVLPKEILKRV